MSDKKHNYWAPNYKNIKYKLGIIDAGEYFFIKDLSVDLSSGYWQHIIFSSLYINGDLAENTYADKWFKVKGRPTKITYFTAGKEIDTIYTLNNPVLHDTLNLKEIINAEEYKNLPSELGELYRWKETVREPEIENELECEIVTLMTISDYKEPEPFEFTALTRQGWSDRIEKVTPDKLYHQEIDKIIFPSVLLSQRSCQLSSKQVFDITRNYIKEHIDTRYAKITSDYNFCFEVVKIIPKVEPEPYTYQNIFARTKKERNQIHTKIETYTTHKIFEMTHSQEAYKGYTIIPAMEAENQDALKHKMEDWLKELIKSINEPYCECPYCKGQGYILQNITVLTENTNNK